MSNQNRPSELYDKQSDQIISWSRRNSIFEAYVERVMFNETAIRLYNLKVIAVSLNKIRVFVRRERNITIPLVQLPRQDIRVTSRGDGDFDSPGNAMTSA